MRSPLCQSHCWRSVVHKVRCVRSAELDEKYVVCVLVGVDSSVINQRIGE